MKKHAWIKEIPFAITVCDRKGVVLEMNDRSCATFEKYGGKKLVGKNLLNCHPPAARSKLKKMLKNETTNAYTIEKGELKKLIYQSPWYEKGKFMGFVEISLPLPKELPHFVRKV